MEKVSSETTVTEEFKHTFPGGITYHERKVNGRLVDSFFNTKSKSQKYISRTNFIYSPELLKLIKTNILHWLDRDIKIPNRYFDSQRIKNPEEFNDWDNVFYNGCHNDGLVWLIKEDTPLSIPQFVDYIFGGYNDHDYDLVALEKHLKKMKNVLDIEKIDIPYYNHNETSGDHALQFIVLVDQKKSDQIFHKTKKFGSTWSCNYRRELITAETLGLTKFRIKRKDSDNA